MLHRRAAAALLLAALTAAPALGVPAAAAPRHAGSAASASRETPPEQDRERDASQATRAGGATGIIKATAARPFRLDLADRNDFVAQTNFVQCVGASMQMMLNIMGRSDRSASTQRRLQAIARDLSGPTRDGFQRKGASVRGWSAGLNELGAGPYRLVGTDTIDDALRMAARSIRQTGRPVGLLVWSGRHAWVMSGFQATADPAVTDAFRVTRAIVLDPLYPYGSSKWGPSPRPREAITTTTLGKQFVPRRRGTWAGAPTGVAGATMSALAGKYVIVMSYTPIPVARDRFIAA
jgi:hypothetical protein